MGLVADLKDKIQGKVPTGKARSSHWPKIRKTFLESNPVCAVCGGKKSLEVHHIHPFHLRPELELDPTNLITLCESGAYGVNCHLFVGHAGNFRKVNEASKEDSTYWNSKLNRQK